jgi:hypothetical protein
MVTTPSAIQILFVENNHSTRDARMAGAQRDILKKDVSE